MKITFKDLSQQKFVLEFEPSTKISAVKEKIAEEKSWEAANLKLIYAGKILKDNDTIESCKIEEKGFVVCMVNKPKTKPKAATAAPATPAAAPRATVTPAAPVAQRSSAAAAAAATSAAATPTPTRSADSFTDPSVLDMRSEAVDNLVAMGFARPEVEAALRAAFFNPDRAVEYLINGIPENLQSRANPPATQAAAAAATAAAPSAVETPTTAASEDQEMSQGDAINLFDLAAQQQSGEGAGAAADSDNATGGLSLGNLDFLRNNPQFQQLRQVVQQQPQMLEPILQQLGAGNPFLAQIISREPEQFLSLLSENVDDDVPLPPGAQAISVTEEEREAIERLCRLGFDRDQAIQAYFACDKNEELAANFLFDQPDDDEPTN